MHLYLLPSLRLRMRALTPICSQRFGRFVETEWIVLALVHRIRVETAHDEQAHASFTYRKLKQLSIWPL
jgi:hypothetical protein